MSTRTALRCGLVAGGTAAGVLLGTPAYARIVDDGAEPGEGLSALETILIFVVAPLGLFLLIALLVVAPSIARGPRYRADKRWTAPPQSFGAAAEVVADEDREPAPEGGGASGRW